MRFRCLPYLLIALGAAACGDDGVTPPGVLKVSAPTVGVDVDPDGYTVLIDGVAHGTVTAGTISLIVTLDAGTYTIELGGLAPNCTPSQTQVVVSIASGATTNVIVVSACAATSGHAQVSVVTTGLDLDADGYALSVDGGAPQSFAVNGSLVLEGLAAGTHEVRLSEGAANCSQNGSGLASFETVTGGLTRDVDQVAFQVTCTAVTGVVAVSVLTEGAYPDVDGYSIQLDATSARPVSSTATTSFTAGPGDHAVTIGDVAAHCAVDGPDTRTVTVTVGSVVRDTARVAFDVACTVSVDQLAGRIAFLSDQDGSVQVYVMNADGSDVKQLTEGTDLGVSAEILSPIARLKWSPDGTRLALAGPGITVIDASDGSDRTSVSRDGSYPAWAQDGSIIRFLVSGVPTLYDVLPDGSDTTATTFMMPDPESLGSMQFDWAPDLSRVAFARNVNYYTQAYVAKPDGSDRRLMVPSLAAHGAPAWSPDGSKIAFWSCEWGIAVVDSSGTGPVTPLAADVCQGVPNYSGIFTTLSWSPDGAHIAYRLGGSIWILDLADDPSPRRVGPDGFVAWAPAWGP